MTIATTIQSATFGAREAITLSEASVVFGRGARRTPALSPTTLKIADGEFLALVGPSGCGKSTILKLVSGLLQPSSGVVVVGGRETSAKALRIGMAFQNPTMLPWLTVEKNVMLPLKIVRPFRGEYRAKRRGEFRDRAHALLDQVGLKGFASKYPWQLSGGMLQRANLCRALIHEPRLLLLDEPSFGLAPLVVRDIFTIMRRINQEQRMAILLVEQNARLALELADTAYLLETGRIVLHGASEDVGRNDAVRRAYLGG